MSDISGFLCPNCGQAMVWDRTSLDADTIHALRVRGSAYWVYEEWPTAWRAEPAPPGPDFWRHVELRCERCGSVARRRLNYMQKVGDWVRERLEGGEELRSILAAVGISECEWRELSRYAVGSGGEGIEPDPAISDEQIRRLAAEMGVTVGWLLNDYTTWPPAFLPPSLRGQVR